MVKKVQAAAKAEKSAATAAIATKGEKGKDEMLKLRQQVKSNQAEVKRLQKYLCMILDDLCVENKSQCVDCPWRKSTTPAKPTPTTTATTTPTTAITTTTTTATKPTPTAPTTTTTSTTTKVASTKSIPTPTVKTTAKIKPTTTKKPTTTTTKKPTATTTTTKKPTTTPAPTPDKNGDCGNPTSPDHAKVVVNTTTLKSDAMIVCSPGYDLIGVSKISCTALWNKQKGDFDYSWAPVLSSTCKQNGEPIPSTTTTKKATTTTTTTKKATTTTAVTKKATTTTTTAPTKPPTKPPTKAATKPPTKVATKRAKKPATEPATKPTTKPTAEKSVAKTKKVVKAATWPLLLKKKAYLIGNDAATAELVLKSFYDSYERLPLRCKQEHPELGCRYGWYYDWRSDKCETLYACLNNYNDISQNYFKSYSECASVCKLRP